jgi:F-type H+-transporting ATPase subunit b
LKHTHRSRISFRLLLTVALSLVPAPTVALRAQQQPAPAAAASPGTGAGSAAPAGGSTGAGSAGTATGGRTAQSGSNDENEYRHSPVVQSLARMLHLPLETAARLFEFINFAILALAIGIPLARVVPKLLRKRSDALRHDLESARKVTADADERLRAVEARLASLDQEIAEIRTRVEEESRNDEARIKASIEEESARIVAAAEQEIATAAAQARRGLRHFAADLAIEKARRQLELTPEIDRALIAEFVSEAQNGRHG